MVRDEEEEEEDDERTILADRFDKDRTSRGMTQTQRPGL
eukprot:COSAG06_NODE_37999_length_428_cov_1.550152_1_plen_38_part_10